jgi:hypothetical protein
MATYVVKIEGQEITLPEEVAKTDEGVKRALQAYYPGVDNAVITRKTDGERVTIDVVKKAGTKGADAAVDSFLSLADLPESRNPAIALAEELTKLSNAGGLNPVVLALRQQDIDDAIRAGEADGELMNRIEKRLNQSIAQPAPLLPMGF